MNTRVGTGLAPSRLWGKAGMGASVRPLNICYIFDSYLRTIHGRKGGFFLKCDTS
jgi:hypothetical protein